MSALAAMIQAKKERSARFARAAYKPAPPPVVTIEVKRAVVVYPQADRHCLDWLFYRLAIAPMPKTVSISRIQEVVSEHYGLPLSAMLTRRRTINLSLPRQIAYWLVKDTNPARSFPRIAARFGNRDHTTIMHGIKKIASLINTNSKIAADVELLRAKVAA